MFSQDNVNNVKTAVFVEPTGSLRDTIIERKRWLQKRRPDEPFCAHPPHCTLFLADFPPEGPWILALQAKLTQMRPFTIATAGWHIFHDDKLAGGGQTIALKVESSPALFELQLAIASILREWRRPVPTRHPLDTIEPFATSLHHYGFPFVGAHWIPHFTITSVRTNRDDPLIALLQAASAMHTFAVESVSIWAVRGDDHQKHCELALGCR